MLTDLNFLRSGQIWPPIIEQGRIGQYYHNKKIFENMHTEVYAETFNRVQRVIGNFEDIISYGVLMNYPKKVSLKTADLLFGEPPRITSGEEGSTQQTAIDKIIENNDLINTSYEAAIDASRYGDGIYTIYRNDEGVGRIEVCSPMVWYPIIFPDNVKRVQYHVLAWSYQVGNYITGAPGGGVKFYLKVHIHEKGFYTEKLFRLAGAPIVENGIPRIDNTKMPFLSPSIGMIVGGIANQEGEDVIVKTELSDFAVVHIPNVATSDRLYGHDDYMDIDSLISELEVRMSQISKILDEHSAPSMQGPPTVAEMGENGKWKVKPGRFFRTVNGEKVEYLTWDGQLESAFKQIDVLLNQLYSISEMGAAIWGDLKNSTGAVPSGSALRRLMVSALAKVNRLKMRFDPAMKKAIKLCSELGGQNIIRLNDVSITWQDGLPTDELENAQIINLRTGSKATMSRHTALSRYDGLSDEQCGEEIERIDEDEAMSNSLNLPGANLTGEPDDPQGDEIGGGTPGGQGEEEEEDASGAGNPGGVGGTV